MKKQLVLFIGSENEYISFIAKNNGLMLKHIYHNSRPEMLEGYSECVIIVSEKGNYEMTHEMEKAFVRVKFSGNTIIYL